MGFLGAMAGFFGLGKSKQDEIRSNTDFEAWIEAHKAWKARLADLVDGNSAEIIDPAVVGVDHQCPLGKWIYSDGMEHFSGLDSFEDLRRAHASFHRTAGEVAQCACDGDHRQARKVLHSKFQARSTLVVSLLRQMESRMRG